MAGIYFHVPFCKQRCIYCDFFASVTVRLKDSYVDSMCQELSKRQNYLEGQKIGTIYFGGGTPSLLSPSDFEKIFDALSVFSFQPDMEITLEANPDDLSETYLDALRMLPFNRISLGVQSFHDRELQFLRRRHNAAAAVRAVKRCQQTGFGNISIDLMYGLPPQTLPSWKQSIEQALALDVPHISAYHLTYEEGTPLMRLMQKKRWQAQPEETSLAMFEHLIHRLSDTGYEHYEISNFARAGYQSRHNSAYWNGTPYLGIGASAHSFDGKSRQWNMKSLDYSNQSVQREILSETDRYNDFIITRLRTMRGIDLQEMQRLFGAEQVQRCLQQAQSQITNHFLEHTDHHLRLTRKGIFISDSILLELIDIQDGAA